MLPTKFWFIWPSGFRGEDLKKSANQKQELPVAAMFVNGSGPSFRSIGFAVSEEKIKMWKANKRQTIDDGRQVMAKAHIAFGKVS